MNEINVNENEKTNKSINKIENTNNNANEKGKSDDLANEINNNLTSGNVLQEAFMLLKGNMLKAFVGTFAYLTPLVLMLFIPYVGLVVFGLLFGHFTVGYITYLKDLSTNNNAKIINIFANRKNILLSILMGAVYISLTLLGLTLFIIPGFIVMAYLGLVFNILESDKVNGLKGVFSKTSAIKTSKKIMFLSYKIMFTIGYLMVILLFVIANTYLMSLYATMPIMAVALYFVVLLVLYSAMLFLTLLLHFCNIIFYNSVQTTTK